MHIVHCIATQIIEYCSRNYIMSAADIYNNVHLFSCLCADVVAFCANLM